MEENHAFNDIRGNPNAPYLNSLANGANAALFSNSFAIEHPSQPNYLDLFSGANQGRVDNAITPDQFNSPNLGAALIAAGRTFVGYSEDLPSVGSLAVNSGAYYRKHNPWSNWQGSASNGLAPSTNQPFTAFPSEFTQLPTLSFVIPNQLHDMHDGSIGQADTWLQRNLGAYAAWAVTHNSLLIVTFDEDDSSQANQIFTLFVGQQVRAGTYGERIDHFRVLRTLEDMYGLPYAGASAGLAPITSVWATSSTPTGIVTASAQGSSTLVVLNPDGTTRSSFNAFDNFTAGLRSAHADVNGDGIEDYVVGTGPGTENRIRVYDGRSMALIADFSPFERTFTGGTYVASRDLNRDGFAEIVVTPDQGGGPVVAVYDGRDLATGRATELARFFGIQDAAFRGGARVGVGDVNGDGVPDVVVSAGFLGGPRVTVWDGNAVLSGRTGDADSPLANFFAFENALRNGTFVAVGDVTGDGFADLIFGGGPGGGPRVRIADGKAVLQAGSFGTLDNPGVGFLTVSNFLSGDGNSRGGIRVATSDLDGDKYADVVTGTGDGQPAAVVAYAGDTVIDSTPVNLFDAAIFNTSGGVYVG